MAEAGGAVVGALRVVLGADTANFDKGLKNAQGGLSSFVRGVSQIATGVALERVLEGFVNSAVHSVKQAFLLGDEINKMSQKVGMSTEELSKLRYAAELSDVPVETLSKSVGKLSRTLVEATTNSTGPAARAFAEMGIKIQDATGAIRPSADIMADLAEKFAGYRDGAEKTALAISIFGRAGAELIPLLNMGRDGLSQASDEAERYGLVISKKTAVAAENFNDNLTRLGKMSEGVAITVASRLLPSFENLSSVMVKSREQSTLWISVGDAIANVMNKIIGVALTLITSWQRIFATVSDVNTALKQLATGEVTAAWNTMTKSATDTAAAVSSVAKEVRQIAFPTEMENAWRDQVAEVNLLNSAVQELGKSWSLTNAPRVAEIDAQKSALDRFLESMAKRTAGMQAEAETVGKSAAQQAYLKTVYEAQAIALNNNIPLTAALNAQIAMTAQNAAMAANQIQAANIAEQVRTPAEKFKDELQELQIVYETTNMTAETFARRQQQLAENVGATWEQAGAGMASGFAQLANQFAKSSKEMAMVAKIAGIAEATINTYTAFTKALASAPPPYNYALAAGVLAAGLAKVAAIKSQNVGGFKTGGSFTVGGSGGPDSQMVQIRATPGERVDVWRPGEGPDPRMMAQGSSAPKEILVRMDDQAIFGIDTTKRIIEAINDAIGYGYKIRVAD